MLFLLSQSDLDSLRAQTQSAQSESDRAASQTAAMMSLNHKLQSSASKNQARSIDLELAKWEAKEHKEMLEIIQVSLLFPLDPNSRWLTERHSHICRRSTLTPTMTPLGVTCSSNGWQSKWT